MQPRVLRDDSVRQVGGVGGGNARQVRRIQAPANERRMHALQ